MRGEPKDVPKGDWETFRWMIQLAYAKPVEELSLEEQHRHLAELSRFAMPLSRRSGGLWRFVRYVSGSKAPPPKPTLQDLSSVQREIRKIVDFTVELSSKEPALNLTFGASANIPRRGERTPTRITLTSRSIVNTVTARLLGFLDDYGQYVKACKAGADPQCKEKVFLATYISKHFCSGTCRARYSKRKREHIPEDRYRTRRIQRKEPRNES